MNMPNATLTKLVQALEAHLGVKLLQRTTRRVSVTPEGAVYYERTGRMLKELEDIDGSIGAAQGRPGGHLRIDMGSSLANLVIVPALPEFLALYPDIRIDLGISDRIVDLVGDNVDCVIRGGTLLELSLVGRQIGAAPWVTCATPAYLKRHGVPREPRDLEKDHLVIGYISSRTSRIVPMHFARDGRTFDITGVRSVGVNESNAQLAAGLAGLGVIQAFTYMTAPHIATGALVPILQEWQPAPYPFYVAYPPNRHVSNRLRVFIDWIADRFPSMAP